ILIFALVSQVPGRPPVMLRPPLIVPPVAPPVRIIPVTSTASAPNQPATSRPLSSSARPTNTTNHQMNPPRPLISEVVAPSGTGAKPASGTPTPTTNITMPAGSILVQTTGTNFIFLPG